MASTKSLEERKRDFLNRLANLYPDYTLISDYVDGNTFITLKHKDGYLWETKPRYLDGKRQCKEVAAQMKSKNVKKLTQQEFCNKFYEKFSKDEYEIIGQYKTLNEEVEIKHLRCGRSWFPIANNAIYHNTCGCSFCYGKTKKTKEEYQELFNLDDELKEYTVQEVFSKDGHVYGKIIHNCDLCENYEFTIRISDMISKHQQRCPKCKQLNVESRACKEITKFLEDNNIEFEKEKRFDSCKNIASLPFDFFIVNTNILIEYDGLQHFKSSKSGFFTEEKVKKIQERDKIKTEWCKNNGYNLIRIKYTQDHLKVIEESLRKLHIID